jgi:uncharacterized protein with PQ loop repeat
MITATATFTASLAVVAPVITIFQALAQGARIRSTGANGVSLGTWLLSAFVAEIWLCYGFIYHVPAEIFANVPCLIVASVVAFLAAKSQKKMSRSTVGYFGLLVITIVATYIGTFPQLRWILAAVAVSSSVIIYLPQLVLVIRPTDVSGVSAISWFTACITALSWLVYGFLIHQLPMAMPSFVMLPAAIVILVQVMRHQIKNDPQHGLQAPIVE